MSQNQNEPGLELHEWETRWAELGEAFEEDPAGALPEACDFVEQALQEGGISPDPLAGDNDEVVASYRAARETADQIERGDSYDPGDVAAAIENLRVAYETTRAGLA